jgi:hypothetical protein
MVKVLLFLIVLTVSLTAVAAEFWVKKPYQNWSADETRRMLEESPWATTYTLSGIQTNAFGNDAPSNTGYRGEMEANPTVSYNIQFRSAATSPSACLPAQLALRQNERRTKGGL